MKQALIAAAACLALAGCDHPFTLETAREAYAKPLGDGRQDDFALMLDATPANGKQPFYQELVKRDILRCNQGPDMICRPGPQSQGFLTSYTGNRASLKNTLLIPAAFRIHVEALKRIIRDESGPSGRVVAAELALKAEPQPFFLKHRDVFDSIEKSNAIECESKPCEIVVNFRLDQRDGWTVSNEQWPWLGK